MAFWIEVRCDMRFGGCMSNRNEGPMGNSLRARLALLKNVNYLEKQALNAGWKKDVTGQLLICSRCWPTYQLSLKG